MRNEKQISRLLQRREHQQLAFLNRQCLFENKEIGNRSSAKVTHKLKLMPYEKVNRIGSLERKGRKHQRSSEIVDKNILREEGEQQINKKLAITSPKKITTVCRNFNQRSKLFQKPLESTSVHPALMIKQLKLISLNTLQEQNQDVRKLQSIQIKLSSPHFRQRSLNNANFLKVGQALKMVIINSSDSSQLNISKTVNNFRSKYELAKKHKSVRKSNFKVTSYKSQQSTRDTLKQSKILSLSCGKPFEPPNVTAKSYIVYRIGSHQVPSKIIISQNCKNRQQIASLTKIMTAILVIEVCRLASIDRYAEEVMISSFQAGISGTTASIRDGQIYTISQLLYGLMLPSGNDASVALAVWAGSKLMQFYKENEFNSSDIQKRVNNQDFAYDNLKTINQSKEQYYKRFLKEMNRKAHQLKLKKTFYANSHGLSNSDNKSCAYDMAILCEYCMKNQTFREIVRSQKYVGHIKSVTRSIKLDPLQIYNQKQREINQISGKKSWVARNKIGSSFHRQLKVQWENTHQLLKKYPEEYVGIKTGFTYTAGPCLASCLRIMNEQYLIIVLRCESMSMRFRDTQSLKKWCFSRINAEKQQFLKLGKKYRQGYIWNKKSV